MLKNNNSNLHAHHRERMRKRFLKNGCDNFNDHEILEMLLFYTIPVANTNETAHKLIHHFGSLKNVFSANYQELLSFDGIGEKSAVFLTFLGEVFQRCNASKKLEGKCSYEKRFTYFKNILGSEKKHEIFMVAFLNDKLEIVGSSILETGNPGQVKIDLYKLTEQVMLSRCHGIIIAHNHPAGEATPSYDDCQESKKIMDFLYEINIRLEDHIIIGQDNVYSMRENGLLS